MTLRQRQTPLSRRERANVVAMPPRAPGRRPPPADLEGPEAELWASIVAEYAIDDAVGLDLLATAMHARGRARRCRMVIEAEGECVKDAKGVARAHVLLVVERGARDSYLMAMRQLNLDIGG